MSTPRTARKGLLNPEFRYRNSASTDIRKTFARIRREQAQQQVSQADAKVATSVVALPKRKAGGQ